MAKKDVSAMVSGAGLITAIFTDLVQAVRARGGSDEDIHRLATPDGKHLVEKFADLIVGVAKKAGDLLTVTVDYSRSLAQMIAAGKYDWVNDDITEKHFPMKGNGKVELNLELAHFNKYISSDDAIAELKKRGLRPATLWELLAFGAKFPETQREFPIVALGSVWRDLDGDRNVPYLWGHADERSLGLCWYDHDWSDNYRFLASRESK